MIDVFAFTTPDSVKVPIVLAHPLQDMGIKEIFTPCGRKRL